MAVKYLDVTGKTEDEAIAKALSQLGLGRDSVSVEILERAKSGFLGFGARPAKVRVTYGLEEEIEVPLIRNLGKESKPATKRPEPREKEARVSPPNPKKETPVSPSLKKKDHLGQPTQPDKAPRSHPGHKTADPQAPRAAEENLPVCTEELGEPCTDEKAQQIRTFLTGLLERMGSAAVVTVYHPEEDRYKAVLEGKKMGQLIGRRGETLDAIQQLTSYVVNRGNEKRVRIHVDAENYRLKREQSLQHLALKVAAKVAKLHRSVTLEPMNAYERHVIHTALQDVENITTYSVGTDPNRRVVVAYDRSGKGSGTDRPEL